MLILADVIGGPAVFILGTGVALGLLLMAVVVEAVVFWRLGWPSVWRAARDALIVNAASGVAGFLLAFFLIELDSIVLVVLVSFALSVAIEGGILLLLAQQPARRVWVAAFLANLASYLIAALVIWALN